MQDPPATVFDDEETVKQPEGYGGHCEEVKRNDHFSMVPQKRKPTLCSIAAAVYSSQVSRHSSFRYDETQFLNFAVDPRRSPCRVLDGHALDEIPDFPVDPRSATTRTGTPTPVEAKTGTVPADYGFWFHDDENIAPAAPKTSKHRPEESVEGMERRPRAFSFEDGDLLAKGEHLKSDIGPAAEEDANHGENGENALSHEITVVTEGSS